MAGYEECKIFPSYFSSSPCRQLILIHKENSGPLTTASSFFPLAKRSYPCTNISSGRSSKCWQPGQVRDWWLSFRFRGAGLTIVLWIAIIALKDHKSCLSNCGVLYYCSGDSLSFSGRVLMADLVIWLALVSTIRVEWHLSLLGRSFRSQCTGHHIPILFHASGVWKHGKADEQNIHTA